VRALRALDRLGLLALRRDGGLSLVPPPVRGLLVGGHQPPPRLPALLGGETVRRQGLGRRHAAAATEDPAEVDLRAAVQQDAGVRGKLVVR